MCVCSSSMLKLWTAVIFCMCPSMLINMVEAGCHGLATKMTCIYMHMCTCTVLTWGWQFISSFNEVEGEVYTWVGAVWQFCFMIKWCCGLSIYLFHLHYRGSFGDWDNKTLHYIVEPLSLEDNSVNNMCMWMIIMVILVINCNVIYYTTMSFSPSTYAWMHKQNTKFFYCFILCCAWLTFLNVFVHKKILIHIHYSWWSLVLYPIYTLGAF